MAGVFFSSLEASTFFLDSGAYSYIYKNLLLKITYALPGVFNNNTYPRAVNGALWSIPYEVKAYSLLLIAFLLHIFRLRFLPLILTVLIFILSYFFRGANEELHLLAPCFAFGSLLAFYKKKLTLSLKLVLPLWIPFFLFRSQNFAPWLFYVPFLTSLLYIFSSKLLLKLRPTSDVSYGVYLWGFFVQQSLVHLFPELSLKLHQVSAISISLVLGFISWHLIEKRGISLGADLLKCYEKLPVAQRLRFNLKFV